MTSGLMLLGSALALLGSPYAADSPLYPIRNGRQLGFIDRTGKVGISPRFDKVNEFQEGVAVVWIGSKAGYIDVSGNLVIQPQYSSASDFEQGRDLVSRDGKY